MQEEDKSSNQVSGTSQTESLGSNQTIPTNIPMGDVGGSAPIQPHSNKTLITGIIALVVILLGVSGVWAYLNYIAPSPEKVLSQSFMNLAKKISDSGELNSTVSVNIEGSGSIPQAMMTKSVGKLDIVVAQQVDFNNKLAGLNMSLNADVTQGGGMSMMIDGDNILDVVISDKNIYVRINSIPQILDSMMTAMSARDKEGARVWSFFKEEVVGNWLKLDPEQLATLSAFTGIPIDSSSLNTDLFDLNNSVSSMTYLGENSVVYVKEVMDSTELNGTSVFHYGLGVNRDALREYLTMEINAQSQSVSVSTDEMTKSLDMLFEMYDQFTAQGGIVRGDVFISKSGRMPVGFQVVLDASQFEPFRNAGGEALVIDMRADYKFDEPVDVSVPSEYSSLMDVLARLGAGL